MCLFKDILEHRPICLTGPWLLLDQQHQHYLRSCQKCHHTSGFILCAQDLHVHKILRLLYITKKSTDGGAT